MNRLPDFIIIGAAKCGTTTLYKMLTAHPKVFMCTPKEPEFFARDDIYQNGLDWYSGLFASAAEDQLCGEASTLYSLTTIFPETVARMHKAVPQAKLIYVLREPVQRSYSYYIQLIKNYRISTKNFAVNRTFEECLFPGQFPDRCSKDLFFAPFDKHLPDDPRSLIDGSRYMTNIKYYLNYFEQKQLLLVDFQDLTEKPDRVMATICEFLGLDIKEMPLEEEVVENSASTHFKRIDRETIKQGLVAKAKNYPFGRSVIKLIPKKFKKRFLDWYTSAFKLEYKDTRPPKMSRDAEIFLHDTLKDEITELEQFWQRDLSSWKQKS